ncbi:Type III secretion inner membrane protein (YscU,SpaS,EscU,HrcU,SsaU) [Pseudomonas sp. R2-37-08W]|uniref:EscU/YscU/HrcU family type III secretion system export apparatus switch protein n=1 Tax=unclassified Pseudomonas TaxID=196821 RepID=UPI000F57F953|nr:MULTISPECIES: EscU/YscU/HrcU family type III secretion system export apparatus switch protein [unclassified Pseudomonas]AZF10359.1 Type III secretion inner membrane protein (YscU,SpaS,EscU,HrcU,SsaU) [Pseudomonas sp. R2-37-08W]AZF20892.1 Type III secretion inner membrane protein (YscU,SpaS,EscU,HrcU,SsaU) [Pseudomonas sp. R3-52-08]MDQ0741108.1 type III secretion YscU/HrpY family protein [Pseudomonas sp. W4I3]
MSASSKTEKPTAKRLRDAAKRGQTFKSKDLVTTCLMLCGITFLVGSVSLLELMALYRRYIQSGFSLAPSVYITDLALHAFKVVAPIILVCLLASGLPSLLLSGFQLASEALKLNLGALNPVNGFKKLFSLRTVKEAIKSLLYLISFVVAVSVTWQVVRDRIFSLVYAPLGGLFAIWGSLLLSLMLIWLACIVLIVLLDMLIEYFLFIKEHRMDKQSVKNEHKEQEGSPETKGRRRELHRELLSEQIKSDIRNSKVVIANPTHIAVGIYMNPEVLPIPFISVMETNQRALAVRRYAEKVGVPVVADVALARRIFKTHTRYSLIKLDEVEQVLRLLLWLEQVENA